MPLDDVQRLELSTLSRRLLDDLAVIADAARSRLGGSSPRTINVIAAGTNPMVDGHRAIHAVSAAYSRARADLERIAREPFVARVVLRWEEDGETDRETLYMTRASAAGMGDVIPKARLATYGAPLGRVAEFPAGSSDTVMIGGRLRRAIVEERVRLHPETTAGQWDAVDDFFEFESWSVAVESIRRLLAEFERAGIPVEDIPDVLGDLLRQNAEDGLIRQRLRRHAIQRIALRDQPILDRHQGEVFRLPVDRRLVLLGPPGTGKTPTLIRRLAQKRMPEAPSEEEVDSLARAGLSDAVEQATNWIMFTPTELLKLYLRDSFNKEGVPAAQENLRTWSRERVHLGRTILRILRSGDSRGFQLDEEISILADSSSVGIAALYDRFSEYFERAASKNLTDAYTRLTEPNAHSVKMKSLVGSLAPRAASEGFSLTDAAKLLDGAPDLQDELKQLNEQIEAESRRLGNRLIRAHPSLLQEIVAAGPSLLGEETPDEEEEDSDSEEPNVSDARAVQPKELKPDLAAQFLVDAVRRRASAVASGRTRVTGRAGRVLGIIGERLTVDNDLAALGRSILARADVRAILRAPRAFVMAAPTLYSRFRREELSAGRTFSPDAGDVFRQQKISGDEVDVLILLMLRNARRLLNANGWRSSGTQDWLEAVIGEHRVQVFVDEATDFSAVQLACTMELSHPQLRSWFACGDLNQRITRQGVQDAREFDWIAAVTGNDPPEIRHIRIGYRQSARLCELATALCIDRSAAPLPNTEVEHADIAPILVENCAPPDLGRWISDRIGEIENGVGMLPSIAVFADGEDAIDAIVDSVKPLLAARNIDIVACKDGRVVGDAQEVRVFDTVP